jgi:putative two-component system response regulator
MRGLDGQAQALVICVGLRETEIPIAARVVAVADVFDALTTKRPYKEAMPLMAARTYLQDKSGSEFDPACVQAFLSRWDDVVAIATAQVPAPRPTAVVAPA